MSANDKQVGGNHYAAGVQHWDFATHFFGQGYLQGQVTKYLCRWRKKNGVQDLEKAQHFLQKLIEVKKSRTPPPASLEMFLESNGVDITESEIIRIVTVGGVPLDNAAALLAALIEGEQAAHPTRSYVDQS